MKRMMKRVSIFLVLIMIFSLMPQGAPAVYGDSDASTIDVSDTNASQVLPTGVNYASNKFTIGTGASATITVSGTTAVNTIVVSADVTGLTLILNGVSITSTAASPIDLKGNANITLLLTDSTTNTFHAGGSSGKAGICTNGTATLSIAGTGSLTATGGSGAAGIGGGLYAAGGNITINNGVVTATGGSGGAGIGGGGGSAGGTININGGTITASSSVSTGSGGAGIGGGGAMGGGGGSGGTINISDGTINATSTANGSGVVGGAGIGGGGDLYGSGGTGGTITITGGTVTANATAINWANTGAGIGGGNGGAGGVISISGGTVIATGTSPYGTGGAGIGGGNMRGGGTITISGGTVTATGARSGAGIGGGSNGVGGVITIDGGTITAAGTAGGSGIGGGGNLTGGAITINAGIVKATGSDDSSGIGGGTGYSTTGGTVNIGASAVVMATSYNTKPAIQAVSGSNGNVINGKLFSAVSASAITYLKCGDNTLTLPATFKNFAFSATTASAVGVYSDQACTTNIYSVVTDPGNETAIPVSTNIYNTATSVKTAVVLTGTVNLTVIQSTGLVTAAAIGGNIASAGTLTYTWTGGATGTGQSATPTLGTEATCTVTASGISGSIQAATTVYKVTVTKSGNTGTDNANINTAFGKVGDSVSIAYTLEGTGTLSNNLTYSGAATTPAAVSSAVGTTESGISTYTIAAGDTADGTIDLIATFAHTNEATPDPGDSGSSHHTGVEIPVIGEAGNLGTPEITVVEGRTITTLTIDAQKLAQILAAQGEKPIIIVPLQTDSDVQICAFDGQLLSIMEDKQAVLQIKTDLATYTLPAQEIDLEAILAQFGPGVDLKDIQITIEIAKASEDAAVIVENASIEGEFTIVVPPVEFNLRCTYGDKTIDVAKFDNFVERTVAIPDGVDPSKITTGIVIDADGTVCHVPTEIIVIDGKYFAKINSLTNSIYSVIWNPITFSDVEKHWAKEAVNDMGSRMVISGVGGGIFEPDRQMTRAEFAAVIVRALGLKPGNGNNKFLDIKSTDWSIPYVETALEYGIISGYDNEHFGPKDLITREQAMTMVARAMTITGLDVKFDADEAEKLLAAFGDGQKSSLWAKDSMAACIKTGIVSGKSDSLLAPKDNITRAEVTVIVRRLLQKSSLI